MRVAIVTESWRPSVDGVVTRLDNTVRHLRRAGHDVLVVAPTVDPETGVAQQRTATISLKFLYGGRPWALPGLALVRALRRFRPDVVHVVNPVLMGSVAVRWAARRYPVVVSYHTDVSAYCAHYHLNWIRPTLHRVMRWVYRQADVRLATSAVGREQLAELGIDDVDIWERGVDVELFNPQRDGSAARRELCPDPEAILVLYVGRLAREKGCERLLPLATGPGPYHVAFVGDGPDRDRLEELFARSRTTFAGFLRGEDLADAYAAADVFVFPSETDTLGLVLLEAMASGLPVVATDSPAARVVLATYPASRLVPPGASSADLARAVADLVGGEPADEVAQEPVAALARAVGGPDLPLAPRTASTGRTLGLVRAPGRTVIDLTSATGTTGGGTLIELPQPAAPSGDELAVASPARPGGDTPDPPDAGVEATEPAAGVERPERESADPPDAPTQDGPAAPDLAGAAAEDGAGAAPDLAGAPADGAAPDVAVAGVGPAATPSGDGAAAGPEGGLSGEGAAAGPEGAPSGDGAAAGPGGARTGDGDGPGAARAHEPSPDATDPPVDLTAAPDGDGPAAPAGAVPARAGRPGRRRGRRAGATTSPDLSWERATGDLVDTYLDAATERRRPGRSRGRLRRFAVVGITNAAVDLLIFNILVVARPTRSAPELVAYNTLAVLAALTNSYLWNSRWTFSDRAARSSEGKWRQRVLFVVQGGINLAVSDVVVAGLSLLLQPHSAIPAAVWGDVTKVIAMLTASGVSFLLMHLFVFRQGDEGDVVDLVAHRQLGG